MIDILPYKVPCDKKKTKQNKNKIFPFHVNAWDFFVSAFVEFVIVSVTLAVLSIVKSYKTLRCERGMLLFFPPAYIFFNGPCGTGWDVICLFIVGGCVFKMWISILLVVLNRLWSFSNSDCIATELQSKELFLWCASHSQLRGNPDTRETYKYCGYNYPWEKVLRQIRKTT